jgi:hypothetical protein
VPGHPDDGDEALQALADIHLVRGLLDRPELVAVTTAPRHGKSWSEIGTTLHVSMQAAGTDGRTSTQGNQRPRDGRAARQAGQRPLGWQR